MDTGAGPEIGITMVNRYTTRNPGFATEWCLYFSSGQFIVIFSVAVICKSPRFSVIHANKPIKHIDIARDCFYCVLAVAIENIQQFVDEVLMSMRRGIGNPLWMSRGWVLGIFAFDNPQHQRID